MNDNTVFQLRQQRLARSTRPFRARGCRYRTLLLLSTATKKLSVRYNRTGECHQPILSYHV